MARREKGEGSLYQAKDKTWVYQYSVDGKRKTKRFRRKADAKAFMAALAVGQEQTEISVEKPSDQTAVCRADHGGGVDGPLAGEVRKAHSEAVYLLQL